MYLPVRALRNPEDIEGVTVSTEATTYLPLSAADALVDAIHVIVVGPVTASNGDTVVSTGGVVTTHSSELKVDSTAGELRTRSTGVYTALAAGAAVALKAADATKDRTSLVVAKVSNGVVSIVDGTLATAGQSKAPACPEGSIALAEVLVKATSTQPDAITDVRPRP